MMINNDKPLGFYGFHRVSSALFFRQNRIQNMQNIILNMSQFAGSIGWMDSEVL